MRKQYSQHGTHVGEISGVIQVSKNTYTYRGFTIRKTPRNAFNARQTYLISKHDATRDENNYLGRDFSLAEAMQTIDRMVRSAD